MNLLRNSLLMRKPEDRRRTELTETFAFLCGFPAEFITRSKANPVAAYTNFSSSTNVLQGSKMTAIRAHTGYRDG